MIEIILFISSLVVMLILLSFRSIEIKRGEDIILMSSRQKSDDLILKIWNRISMFFSNIWKFIINEIKKVFHFVLHIFVSIWEYFVHKSAKYIDMIRGRDVINNRGSISYFVDTEEDDLQN